MAASYISVPRDLTKVKSKVMFNLTKRQLICFGAAALIGVPSFFLIKEISKVNTAVMAMMFIMMPFFFLSMYEKNGQPLEKVVHNIVQVCFLRPKQRPYQTDNFYAVLERQEKLDKEVYRIVHKKKAHESGKERNRSRHRKSEESR